MTSDSELAAFVNHAIQLALDLTTYPSIWVVLSILLDTQDVNTSYVQVMHNYYNQSYNTRTDKYMVALEKAAEQSKHNMYNNILDGVSAYVQQPVCDPPVQSPDQQDANAENCTQLPYNAHFNPFDTFGSAALPIGTYLNYHWERCAPINTTLTQNGFVARHMK